MTFKQKVVIHTERSSSPLHIRRNCRRRAEREIWIPQYERGDGLLRESLVDLPIIGVTPERTMLTNMPPNTAAVDLSIDPEKLLARGAVAGTWARNQLEAGARQRLIGGARRASGSESLSRPAGR
ncbi:hypothetical protein [Salinispora pacifica]|uniref:hypothetical protein n=1 Tax=Salinispora pacifica TaxID=351187 RepID=UPI0012BD5341|nr:hypothetical protein [Salinispora pacifica]